MFDSLQKAVFDSRPIVNHYIVSSNTEREREREREKERERERVRVFPILGLKNSLDLKIAQ